MMKIALIRKVETGSMHVRAYTHTHKTKHTWGERRVRGVRVDILTFSVLKPTQ